MVTRYRIPAVIVLVALLGTVAAGQDYFFTNFRGGHQDHVLPQAPCSVLGSVQPIVYDRSIWFAYTCADGRVIARRFLHPNDSTIEPVYVRTGRDPLLVTTSMPGDLDLPQPPNLPPACPGNFVAGVFGGCVPPDHPHAVR